MIRLDLFKGGRKQALAFSYDDGRLADERLLEIFNRYGIKATFNLNSARIGHDRLVFKRRYSLRDPRRRDYKSPLKAEQLQIIIYTI